MNPLIVLALACGAVEPVSEDVFFKFDSAQPPEDTQARLEKFVTFARQHPNAKIVIDGNADSTGNANYNAALSLRRAEAIHADLRQAGICEKQLVIAAFGENSPRRVKKAFDRRVTITTTEEPRAQVAVNAVSEGSTCVRCPGRGGVQQQTRQQTATR